MAGKRTTGLSYPRTLKTGPLAGKTFLTEGDHMAALKSLKSGASVPDSVPNHPKPAAPAKYQKQMIEAVVTMIQGVTGFIPMFRENPITKEEHDWLVDDWFAFGKVNPFFARLIVNLFAVDIYGKLIMDHVCIVGARMAGSGMLPQASMLPIQLAYMARQAMSGESVTLDDLGMAAGPAPGSDRRDGDGQDVPGPETFDAQAA